MYPDYIDLHCDTALDLYRKEQQLKTNNLAISIDKAAVYPHYAQLFAVWGHKNRTDEETYTDFLAVTDCFAAQLDANRDTIVPVRSGKQLRAAWDSGKIAAILAVEDARLLAGDLGRLDVLAERGIAYLTLMWAGESIIGGAHDTEAGLTAFGREVVKRCFELGILPDISHASARSADEILTLAEQAGRPVIASHSNAHAVYPHSRNLRDEHFKRLMALGGIVGFNLCHFHIKDCRETPTRPEDLLPHIEHFLSLGGERHLAMGGDLDGATLPVGMTTVSDVAILADVMRNAGYSEDTIRRIFGHNALTFFEKHLG